MKRIFQAALLAGGTLLVGCAAPVGEQIRAYEPISVSEPIATIQTEPENHIAEFPPRYYGANPPRQFLRGGSGSTPLRYNMRIGSPAIVGERLSNHPANLPGGQERLVATETYGLWQ